MKKTRLIALTLVFCFGFLALTGNRSWAVNYDEKIDRMEEKKKELNSKVEEIKKEMKELAKDEKGTLEYIEKLDKKTSKMEKELEDVAEAIDITEEEIEEEQEQLKKAEETEKIQYATMKKRIKYMYENGNQDYVDIIFTSKNISDLLNRTEYVEKIGDYDKKMFVEYQNTKNEIEEKSKKLQYQLESLENYEYEQKEEKKALDELKKQKKEELKKYREQKKNRKKEAEDYSKQAAKAEADVEKLLIEKQKEIDRINAVGGGSGTGGDGTLEWPLGSPGRISSGFGKRKRPTAGASTYHKGIDVDIAYGTPILAAGDGRVVTATYSSSAGNFIMISHGNRLYTVYMHCSRLAVNVGDEVIKGQTIGYVGSTGISTGAHLHFGVSKNGSYVNPLDYVKQP